MELLKLTDVHFKRNVLLSNIIRLEGERNYTRFVLSNGQQIVTSRTLLSYERILPQSFVRTHKNCIINLLYFKSTNAANTSLRLSDGCHVLVARRRIAQLFERLKTFENLSSM